MDQSALVAAVGLVIGGIVWLVRLEGRQNLSDARWLDLKDDIAEIKADVKIIKKNGT